MLAEMCGVKISIEKKIGETVYNNVVDYEHPYDMRSVAHATAISILINVLGGVIVEAIKDRDERKDPERWIRYVDSIIKQAEDDLRYSISEQLEGKK